MDDISASRIIALRDVQEGDNYDYFIRKVMREYSKNFNTALHLVEELPLLDVLTAYWENFYEGLTDEQIEKEIAELGRTEEQLKLAQKAEDKEDYEAFREIELIKKEDREAKAKEAIKKLEDVVSTAMKSIIPKRRKDIELDEGVIPKAMPGIHMKFADLQLDEDADSFGLLEKPRK